MTADELFAAQADVEQVVRGYLKSIQDVINQAKTDKIFERGLTVPLSTVDGIIPHYFNQVPSLSASTVLYNPASIPEATAEEEEPEVSE